MLWQRDESALWGTYLGVIIPRVAHEAGAGASACITEVDYVGPGHARLTFFTDSPRSEEDRLREVLTKAIDAHKPITIRVDLVLHSRYRNDIHIPLWHHEIAAMHEGRLKVLLRPNFSTFDSYAGEYQGEVVIVRHGEYRFRVFDCDEDWLQPWDVSDELAAKNGNMADPTPSQSFLKWWRDSMPGRNAHVWIWHLRPIVPETREN